MHLAWLTDIHLNFLSPPQFERFTAAVRDTNADVILITGDVSHAPHLEWHLKQLQRAWGRPVYFVLGNHDFYGSTISGIRALARQLSRESHWLRWLTDIGLVELTPTVALVGHEGWADGRIGDYFGSQAMLNDYILIRDLSGLSKEELLRRLNNLGDEAAAHFRLWLPRALEKHQHVYVATHVPPFREASWHEGGISSDDYLPFFTCKAVGDALVEIMTAHPTREATVLCGHTHGRGEIQVLSNLKVLTGGADYGKPEVQRVFEIA
jgi:predicted phosphohydrolase